MVGLALTLPANTSPMINEGDDVTRVTADQKRVAVKWLTWQHGMTVEEADARVSEWPVGRQACEAVDVAMFVAEALQSNDCPKTA